MNPMTSINASQPNSYARSHADPPSATGKSPSSWFTAAAALCLASIACAAQAAPKPTASQTRFFEQQIRPLLVKHCYECHSKDAKKIKGGLVLDTKMGWQAGGDSGEAIIPGNPDKSLLMKVVKYEEDDMEMPPKYKLKDAEIQALHKWVQMGAPDPRLGKSTAITRREIDVEKARSYWAFTPVKKQPIPKVKDIRWPISDIDYYVLAKLEAKGLQPVIDADRNTLLRRATFDLIGLPPTPKQISDFKNDPAPLPKAFAKVIDRLLESKQFGIRWGRHWLDVARYAESVGGTRNYPFNFAWRYRDYVINAFNADLPFDRFITEQIAGDLLPAQNAAHRNKLTSATGFLALGAQDLNETDTVQFTSDVVNEQVDMTSRSFLALTMGCARCHDHKFDPIAQTDYYAVAGIFNSTNMQSGVRNRGRGGNSNYVSATELIELQAVENGSKAAPNTAAASVNSKQQKIADLTKLFNETRTRVGKLKSEQKKLAKSKLSRTDKVAYNLKRKQLTNLLSADSRRLREIAASLKKLGKDPNKKKKGGGKLPHYNFAMGAIEGTPINAKVNIKGDPHTLGKTVPRGFIRVATDPKAPTITLNTKQSGRRQLAQWIARKENPLTARVMVNRIWHHLFGVGIVRTTDNFGVTGAKPTHPKLLDHLASSFVKQGWSVKKAIREMMLTRTYMLASDNNDKNNAVEPDNTLLWRANHRRLEVEAIRDAVLYISGNLMLTNAGPSPVMKSGNNDLGRTNASYNNINTAHRSVYVPVVRQMLPPMWETFDFADPAETKGARDVTTVAPQALFMMNNPFVLKHARSTADRLVKLDNIEDRQRIERAFQLTLSRMPTSAERNQMLKYIKNFETQNKQGKASAWAAAVHALFASAEFRYVN
jgi:hypothetical protein